MQLSSYNARTVIAALLAVSPSGGGSDTYTLARDIAKAHGYHVGDISLDVIARFQEIAANEAGF